MDTTVKFTGCEHLDFEPAYAAKRQLTSEGLFWMRKVEPSMVQFCKKNGRIYGCGSCLSEKNKQCDSYHEVEHIIQVPTEELES